MRDGDVRVNFVSFTQSELVLGAVSAFECGHYDVAEQLQTHLDKLPPNKPEGDKTEPEALVSFGDTVAVMAAVQTMRDSRRRPEKAMSLSADEEKLASSMVVNWQSIKAHRRKFQPKKEVVERRATRGKSGQQTT